MSTLVALVIIFLTFYIMSGVIDKRFLPSLDRIAAYLKMPESVSGATLLAFGTSAPEISTALFALFLTGASPALGIGTIVGSAIFQILAVIGFAALIKTSYLNWKPVVRDSVFYALSILLLILFIRDGQFTFTEALIFVTTYGAYLVLLFVWARYVEPFTDPSQPDVLEGGSVQLPSWLAGIKRLFFPIDWLLERIPDVRRFPRLTLPVFILSLIIIGYICYWLVIAGEALATNLGIPAAIIALTILAGGTSIPELISSAIVSRQGRGDMAIANAIGSNIFDILMSLGLPLLIFTAMRGTLMDVGGENISSSLLLLFFTLIMVISLLAAQKFKATRPFGILLMGLYVMYVAAAYLGWLQ